MVRGTQPTHAASHSPAHGAAARSRVRAGLLIILVIGLLVAAPAVFVGELSVGPSRTTTSPTSGQQGTSIDVNDNPVGVQETGKGNPKAGRPGAGDGDGVDTETGTGDEAVTAAPSTAETKQRGKVSKIRDEDYAANARKLGLDPAIREVPKEDPIVDGAQYNVSGADFVSDGPRWMGKCWYKVTNFCVVKGVMTVFHPKEQGGVRGGSLRMCNEFTQRSPLVRLKYRSEPVPDVLPGPLLTKTPGWILQFWCQDLFHMTLSMMPAFHTLKHFEGMPGATHPDLYLRIARGRRPKGQYCHIKFGHPNSYDLVQNLRWGGDKQFPFSGNPYWPFYRVLSKEPHRLHPLYKDATQKTACYKQGIVDKVYLKELMSEQAREYSNAQLRSLNITKGPARSCSRKYRVTLIDRRGRTRKLSNVPELVEAVEGLGGFQVTPVALEHITIKEQLELITSTDVLLGVHGNALTWLQFLPPGSVVIEMVGVWYMPYAKLWGHTHLHSSMKNNQFYKKNGEYVPFPQNVTELKGLMTQAKELLDKSTGCNGQVALPLKNERLENLYADCAPHC